MRLVAASRRSDQRGFALQTIIVMTALIAIALAVSAVIITRGGEVADDLEERNFTFDPTNARTEASCLNWAPEYEWQNDACVLAGP